MIYLITFLIWIIGIVVMELQLSYQKKYKRHEYNKRHHGLITFSDKQLAIMRWLWPITILIFVFVFIFVLFINLFISAYQKFKNEKS